MTKTICIYHGNCADGFTSAWAVWKKLGDQVEYFPGFYGAEPPDVTGADVIMVDFSYKRPVIDQMAETCRTMLILDHHKTAAADLDGLPKPIRAGWENHLLDASGQLTHDVDPRLPRAIFDMDRSGAQITWDFFHPPLSPRPILVDYVGDRDLWRFELPQSREIAAWLFSHNYNFKTWDRCGRSLQLATGVERAAAEGAAIERKHHKDIAELLKITKRTMVIGGFEVPVANLPYTMSSDAAGQLAESAPFGACYFDRNDGTRVFSLRSRGEDGADVSEIAKIYGGGGHKNAAGFQAPAGWCGE